MDSRTLHVAIIMDGNGRWATDLGLPRALGHRAGAEALRRVVEAAPDMGVETLTAYAFSADNWQRPQEEVNALMELLAWYLEDDTPRMAADGVRLSVIGRRDRLPVRLLDAIRAGEAMIEDVHANFLPEAPRGGVSMAGCDDVRGEGSRGRPVSGAFLVILWKIA